MRPVHVDVAYSPLYLSWQLGEGHPTDPRRAQLAVNLLAELCPTHELVSGRWELDEVVEIAEMVHDRKYVRSVLLEGRSSEWEGRRPDLGRAAATMFAGTVVLMHRLCERDWTPGVSFNPQGAKHHAARASSSGFCVLNDHAWAAAYALALGKRVAVLDWDVHHGDGTEVMLWHTDAVTLSIHQSGIFPGTGRRHHTDAGVYNYPLLRGVGDSALLGCVKAALEVLDLRGGVDVLLLAAGADGLGVDPLGGLEYSLPGLYQAAGVVGEWCALRGVPVVVGGAGGYTPLRETPMAWAGVVRCLVDAYQKVA